MSVCGEICAEAREKRVKFLSDRSRMPPWGVRVLLVLLHVFFVGGVVVLHPGLLPMAIAEKPWQASMYVALLAATIFQFFLTSASSPGFVIDAMRACNGTNATFINTTTLSKQSSSKNGSFVSPSDDQLVRENMRTGSSPWLQQVRDLYPPALCSSREWTCSYCHIVQPPRSKHCHDCDKCVLQFDHHCIWLGTCIGRKNHCQFWWYIFVETMFCFWTAALYAMCLHLEIPNAWLKNCIAVLMLAALSFITMLLLLLLIFHSYLACTNQTTYEVARRRRIVYLRGVSDKVHPFSQGVWRNLCTFCCSRDNGYVLEAIPPIEELNAKVHARTSCLDVICCQ